MISPTRIFGAIGLVGGGDKTLDSIPHNLVKQDDVAIVSDNGSIYFYVMDFDSGLDENVPYVIKPDDIEEAVNPAIVYKRWHLVSTKYFTDNIIQSHGKYIQTDSIKAWENENLEFISADGIKVVIAPNGTVTVDGSLVSNDQIKVQNGGWKTPFVVDSTLLVENLNADKLDGYHASALAKLDGSDAFTGQIKAPDPINSDEVTTIHWVEEYVLQVKNVIYSYIDDQIASIDIQADIDYVQQQLNNHLSPSSDDHTQYIHIDGRRNFIAPIGGVDPILSNQLTTKNYVDNALLNFTTIHGELLGLDADDHLQYIHKDGRRGFTNPIEGKTPLTDFHLATKEYVDEKIANIFHTKDLQIHTFDDHDTEWVINHNLNKKYIIVNFYNKFDNKQIIPETFTLLNDDTAVATFAVGIDGYAVVTGITEHYDHIASNNWIIEHTFANKEVIFNVFDNNNVEIFPDTVTIIDDSHISFTFTSLQSGYVVMSNDITVFDFNTNNTTEWYIYHNYNNKNILINCFDSNNIEIEPKEIEATDDNTLLITFNDIQTGYAVISGSEAVILDPSLYIINHSYLTNLGADDHSQYILADGTRDFSGVVNGIYPILPSNLTTKQYVDDEIQNISNTHVIMDHGDLTGLGDDDHHQYILADGTRDFTGPVNGVTPTQAYNLATKQYVDSMLTSSSLLPQSGLVNLVNGADNITVHLLNDMNNRDYAIDICIENTIDLPPSIYTYIIVRKTTSEFDIVFSANIDSDNYKLNWTVYPI